MITTAITAITTTIIYKKSLGTASNSKIKFSQNDYRHFEITLTECEVTYAGITWWLFQY